MVKIAVTVKTFQAEAELKQKAICALEQCLRQVPGVQVVVTSDSLFPGVLRPDVFFDVSFASRRVTVLGKALKTGEPQYVRAALYQLERYRDLEPTAVSVVIAPYISPEAARLCRNENAGYQDLAGNCHIAFDGVYIHVEGKPNPFAHSRLLVSLYRPKAERVLRVLLSHSLRPWRLQELAEETGVSIGQVFKVKELLLEKDWLEEGARGVTLTKPNELLDGWAQNYRLDKHQSAQFYTLANIDSFGQALSTLCRQHGIPCAFTSFAAAARYAPHATYRRTTAYVHHETPEIQELLRVPPIQLEPVETGADVILLSPYDDGVFYAAQQREGFSLVSPLQTYLDLQSAGGRGREAADLLFQKEIAPKW